MATMATLMTMASAVHMIHAPNADRIKPLKIGGRYKYHAVKGAFGKPMHKGSVSTRRAPSRAIRNCKRIAKMLP